MAPITWKNINAPDFRNTQLGLSIASDAFDKAGSSLSNILNTYQKNDDANWHNQAAINTEDYIARLKSISDLNGLNDQEPNFDPTVLRASVGRQINNEALQAELLKRKGILTGEAVNAASGIGLDQAKSTLSAAAATEAFRQKLIDSGIKDPNVINAEVAKFTQNTLSPIKESWKEQGDKFGVGVTANLLSQDTPIAPLVQPMQSNPIGSNSSFDPIAYATSEAQKYGLDPALVMKVMKVESGNNGSAVSPKGAKGYMQVMPGTFKEMGGTDPNDPRQNISAGIKYLKQNIDKFGGSIPLGLAAYNAGPGRVTESGNNIPNIPETQEYVKKIYGTPTQQVGQQLTQAIQMGIPVTTEQANSLKTLANQQEQNQKANLLFSQNQEKIALDKDTDTTVAKIWQETRANGGDPRPALIKYTEGKINSGDIAEKFNDQYAKLTRPTEQETATQELLQKKLASAAEVQSAQDAKLVNEERLNLNMVNNLKSDDPLLQAANTHIGGIAGAIKDKTDDTGFISKQLSGLSFNNDVLDKLSELHNELTDSGNGYTPELANRVIIQAIRLSAGPREKAIGSNKGLDMNKLYKNLPQAARMEDAIGIAQGKVATYEGRAAINAAKDKATIDELTKTIKDEFVKSRITGSKFEGKDANDWAMKRLIEARKAIEPAEAPTPTINDEIIKRRQELVKRLSGSTYEPITNQFGFGFGH